MISIQRKCIYFTIENDEKKQLRAFSLFLFRLDNILTVHKQDHFFL